MSVTRRNILESDVARQRFLNGVVALNQEPAGITSGELGAQIGRFLSGGRIFGQDQPLTTWDLFVAWHFVAMSIRTNPQRPLRNLAHGGPVFLPWHRLFLMRLEEQLQRVTDDATVGLPYWDWAAHGELRPAEQRQTALWGERYLGNPRGDVTLGPLAAMRVRLDAFRMQLWSVPPRPLRRAAGQHPLGAVLPTRADVRWAMANRDYDGPQWDAEVDSFRNRVEGWLDPNAQPGQQSVPQLHNRVHVWVGGDMEPGTSPNDPVFYLNHCNEDRIWEVWMSPGPPRYRPVAGDVVAPSGHLLTDELMTLLGDPKKPSDLLDLSTTYVYDSLNVG